MEGKANKNETARYRSGKTGTCDERNEMTVANETILLLKLNHRSIYGCMEAMNSRMNSIEISVEKRLSKIVD